MKEVVKVNLAGIAFVFESDAYRAMRAYVDLLERSYASNPDGAEIVADIEARMAELILSEQPAGQPVALPLVERIVARMGRPGGEEAEPEDSMPSGDRFPRRLYRNREGARIGGVCSGLGTWFGVDPVWIRLGFCAPLLIAALGVLFGLTLFGLFVLLYLLLWFAIPQARTPRQRLEMQGEKITVRTIEHRISVDKRREADGSRRRFERVWAELIYVLGRIALFGIKGLALLVALVLGVAGIGLLVALPDVVAGAARIDLPPLAHGAEFGPVLLGIVLFLLIFIPIMLVVWWLLGLVFGWRSSRTFVSIAGGLWLIALVYMIVVLFRSSDRIRHLAPVVDGDRNRSELFEMRRAIEAEGVEPDDLRLEWVRREGDSVVFQLRSIIVRDREEGAERPISRGTGSGALRIEPDRTGPEPSVADRRDADSLRRPESGPSAGQGETTHR